MARRLVWLSLENLLALDLLVSLRLLNSYAFLSGQVLVRADLELRYLIVEVAL